MGFEWRPSGAAPVMARVILCGIHAVETSLYEMIPPSTQKKRCVGSRLRRTSSFRSGKPGPPGGKAVGPSFKLASVTDKQEREGWGRSEGLALHWRFSAVKGGKGPSGFFHSFFKQPTGGSCKKTSLPTISSKGPRVGDHGGIRMDHKGQNVL